MMKKKHDDHLIETTDHCCETLNERNGFIFRQKSTASKKTIATPDVIIIRWIDQSRSVCLDWFNELL